MIFWNEAASFNLSFFYEKWLLFGVLRVPSSKALSCKHERFFDLLTLVSSLYETAQHCCDYHIRECIADRKIDLHQHPVNHKADEPEDQTAPVKVGFFTIPVQNEKVCDLYGDHRCEDRADQIEEIGDVIHREQPLAGSPF